MRRFRPTRALGARGIPGVMSLLLVGACASEAGVSGAASGALARREQGTRRPNIVFIFSDDHASHAISAYGSRINETPNIDRIAREGMLFRHCFVTNSICAPSRAVILTGKHSHLNGQITNRERFDGAQETFPKVLQAAGYQTAMIGKWHLKSDPTGFDYWRILRGQGAYYNPRMRSPGGPIAFTGYTTDIITDLAIKWMKTGRAGEKPFMLMCQHKAPHRNWQPGPEHLSMYDDVEIPEPDNLFDDYSGRSSAARTQKMTVARHLTPNDLKLTEPKRLTPEQRARWDEAYGPKNATFRGSRPSGREGTRWNYQRYIKDYLRCVAAVDDGVGRILDYLDQSGLAANTIVIYSSDQGFYLGDHGWYDKRWMYEESLRTPLLIRWPGVVRPGSEDRHLVQNLDFAQTFLEMAGAEAPGGMQGRSLVGLLGGERPEDWRKSIYYHYYEYPGAHGVRRHYGVRTERYKLIYYYNLDEWELFDLAKDPHEMQSVYGDPEHAGVVAELKRELERLRQEYRVPEDTRPVERRGGKR
ncbi:MAG: sulfatase [Planctomycetota bacterium]